MEIIAAVSRIIVATTEVYQTKVARFLMDTDCIQNLR